MHIVPVICNPYDDVQAKPMFLYMEDFNLALEPFKFDLSPHPMIYNETQVDENFSVVHQEAGFDELGLLFPIPKPINNKIRVQLYWQLTYDTHNEQGEPIQDSVIAVQHMDLIIYMTDFFDRHDMGVLTTGLSSYCPIMLVKQEQYRYFRQTIASKMGYQTGITDFPKLVETDKGTDSPHDLITHFYNKHPLIPLTFHEFREQRSAFKYKIPYIFKYNYESANTIIVGG